jgi:hypothetical protein
MAVRKKSGKKAPNSRKPGSKKPAAYIFWAAFFVIIIGLFLVNGELIRRTLRNTQFMERLFDKPEAPDIEPVSPDVPPDQGPVEPVRPSGTPEPEETVPSAPPVSRETEAPRITQPPPEAADGAPPVADPVPAAERPEAANRRERTLYFVRLDRDGTIVRTQVRRTLPASDSPMLDVLRALLQGPSAEEQRRDLISLIPQGTRILSATVRGDTAYISFSEEFQFNTYGVEGYAAQLRQIVWTVTEFSTVKDVQILIEGRRVDYLGEGIWIGSPVDRDTL